MKSTANWWWIFFLFLLACREVAPPRSVTRGFYYWKSQVVLTATEQRALEKLQVRRLYVKFFDVVWDGVGQQPLPVAKVQFGSATKQWLSDRAIEIVPTVFITNECMLQLDGNRVGTLAQRLHDLVAGMAGSLPSDIRYPEIQVDCDWTAGSRDRYFGLLTHLRALPFFKDRILSATIRLYQCKYRQRTGIPPVDRGLLMCYNMGNLKNPDTKNSILETAELQKYTGNLEEYPLPLDLAMPLFDWKVLYQERVYKGLIQGLPDSLLQQTGIAIQKGNRFTLLNDTLLCGYALKKGDLLRQEDATFAEIKRATRLVEPKLKAPSIAVALYHLDSITLHKYSLYELEEIFDSVH